MWTRSRPGSPAPTAGTETGSHAAPPRWLLVAVGALAVASLGLGVAAWMTARLVERELVEVAVQRSEDHLHRLATVFGELGVPGAKHHRLPDPLQPSPHHVLAARVLSPGAVVLKTSVTDEIGRRLDVAPALTAPAGVVWRAPATATRPGIIRLTRPVSNEPRCFSCHDSQLSVLGFVSLDVAPDHTNAAVPFWALSGAAGTTATLSSLLLVGLAWRSGTRGRSVRSTTGLGIGIAATSVSAGHHDVQLLRTGRLAALGELMSRIAHEVKTPLTGIGAAVQVLARGFAEDDPRREISEEILAEVRRLQHVVRGVLDAASVSPNLVVADLRAPLERTLFLVRTMARDQGTTLVEELGPELPPIRIDTRQLQQVVLNLAMNALQAVQQAGTVTVSAVPGPAHRWLDITVQDTGPGIHVEDQQRIFEPFYTTKRDGTGLGLTIVRQIVEAHGGRITVESRPAAGTCFTVRLFSTAPAPGEDAP